MTRYLLRALALATLCVAAGTVTLVALTTTRLEMRPGTLFYGVLVPRAWRQDAMRPFAQPVRYESVPADGPSEAVLRIEVLNPSAEAFARYMAAQGYVRELETSQSSSSPYASSAWRSWAGPKGMVQTDIEAPCAGGVPCRRTIIVLPGATP